MFDIQDKHAVDTFIDVYDEIKTFGDKVVISPLYHFLHLGSGISPGKPYNCIEGGNFCSRSEGTLSLNLSRRRME